jgi:serine/threonine-protein kinase
MANWNGRTIGGYQLAEEIGRGGMAAVYRAYQPQLERWVAIKILQTVEARSEEFLARFRREAKAIAALRHPNILSIYDYGEVSGIAYIVMEYVPGGSLKAQLTGEPMPWPEAAKLIIPVGRALAHAHSRDIVHRDVKPANILLSRPDWPRLADFGLVKILGRQRGITKPGMTIGTPAYFSPEQAIGGDIDHRSDIYSLGIVLYEMLTGNIPFKSDSPTDMLLRRLREPPVPPRQINSNITPHLNTVILRAMAQDREDRYPTMDIFVANLSQLLESADHLTPGQGSTNILEGSSPEDGPRLVVMGTGACIPLPQQGSVLIGRADPQMERQPDVDLGLHGGGQAGVSRRHARLIRRSEAKNWLLEDLQSTNGTLLNDTPVPPGQPLQVRDQDVICCGQLRMVFHKA